MTREECEKLIKQKIGEIWIAYKEYRGNTNYLTMVILGDIISFNNRCWQAGEDEKKPIDWHGNIRCVDAKYDKRRIFGK